MSRSNLTKICHLREDQLLGLVRKCDSAIKRKKFTASSIVRYCVTLLVRLWANRKAIPPCKNILVLSPRLKRSFEEDILRYEKILKRFDGVQPVSLSDARLGMLDILAHTKALIEFVFFYRKCTKGQKDILGRTYKDYFSAMVMAGFLKKIVQEHVIFYGGSYYTTYFFMAIKLREGGIKTIIYLNSPLLDRDDIMYVDEVVLYHSWQRDHAKKILRADKYTLGSCECSYLVPPYRRSDERKRNSVAIYSSGTYIRYRLNFHRRERLREYLSSEVLMTKVMESYARKYASIVLRIFLHPGIEDRGEARQFYSRLLCLANVRISDDGRSQDSFDDYELGISSISATLFERIEGGHKSCFVFPSRFFDVFRVTPLRNIVVENYDNAIERIECMRLMPRSEYFKSIGFSEVPCLQEDV